MGQQHDAAAETEVVDVRDVTVDEPAQVEEDMVRVPLADETADTVDRAQRALAEIAQRQAADQAREADEAHAAQLAHWQTQEQATEADHAAEQCALEVGAP